MKRDAALAGFAAVDFAGHSLRVGFLTSAAESGANIFTMLAVSSHKQVDTVRGYVHSAELSKDHAGGLGFCEQAARLTMKSLIFAFLVTLAGCVAVPAGYYNSGGYYYVIPNVDLSIGYWGGNWSYGGTIRGPGYWGGYYRPPYRGYWGGYYRPPYYHHPHRPWYGGGYYRPPFRPHWGGGYHRWH